MFTFVNVQSPGDAKTHKKTVRSHAARRNHARQKRVIRYQDEQMRQNEIDIRELQLEIVSECIGNSRQDPFNSFVKQLSRLEWKLLNHCKMHDCV